MRRASPRKEVFPTNKLPFGYDPNKEATMSKLTYCLASIQISP